MMMAFSRMLRRSRRDSGDVMLSALILVIAASMFVVFIASVGWATAALSVHNQRNSLAQEAADVAIAQALYTLNENYGAVTDSGTYVTTSGAYDRTLPSAKNPTSADMTQFNATKQTALHSVTNGKYGIQAQARWWVDVFDVTYADPSTVTNVSRLRAAGQVGNLIVEARVVTPDLKITYGYRSVSIPLYQMQANAVLASSDGKGLRYIASPLSLFQYTAFGTDGVFITKDAVKVNSPVATSGSVTIANPTSTFDTDASTMQRFDANIYLYGSGQCMKYDTSSATTTGVCQNARSVNTGFEVQPDTALVTNMSDYCAANGLDDYIASEQTAPSIAAADATYCFRDLVIDADVRLMPTSGSKVVRIFVQRNVIFKDGHHFINSNGSSVWADPNSDPQAAIYTLSPNVTIEGSTTSTQTSKFYLYAPNANCRPGQPADDPSTTSVDESLSPSNDTYIGAFVCKTVDLDYAKAFVNQAPFADLVQFGSSGFGSDLYPNNLWYLNTESTEFLPREDW